MPSRKHEQADLIYKLGALFGPLEKVTAQPLSIGAEDRARIIARYFSDLAGVLSMLGRFATSEAGHDYSHILRDVEQAAQDVADTLRATSADPAQWKPTLEVAIRQCTEAILAVPVSVESAIHLAQTPFSTYCLVRDVCATTAKELVWLDRYFDASLFYRYLIDCNAAVTLVTYPQTKCHTSGDKARYAEFLDASRLFAKERGPTRYRLITNDKFHTRWLRCDDRLFTFGESIKEIGRETTFTVGKLDSTPDNLAAIDTAVKNGTEEFGPQKTTHP